MPVDQGAFGPVPLRSKKTIKIYKGPEKRTRVYRGKKCEN